VGEAEPGDVVARALAAFAALSAGEIDAQTRAQRLRVEVRLPLARHFGAALDDAPEPHTRAPETPARAAQAAIIAARACLLMMGSGRATLRDDLLREVSRLGEAFCALNLSASRALGLPEPHEAARLAAALRVVARERSLSAAPPAQTPALVPAPSTPLQRAQAPRAPAWPAPRDHARDRVALALTVGVLVAALLWGVHTARRAIAEHRAAAAHDASAAVERLHEQR
jgi:hypothetical protein